MNNKKVYKGNKVYKKVFSCDWKGYEYEFQKNNMYKQDEKLTLAAMKRNGITPDNKYYKRHCEAADRYENIEHWSLEHIAYMSFCGIEY